MDIFNITDYNRDYISDFVVMEFTQFPSWVVARTWIFLSHL